MSYETLPNQTLEKILANPVWLEVSPGIRLIDFNLLCNMLVGNHPTGLHDYKKKGTVAEKVLHDLFNLGNTYFYARPRSRFNKKQAIHLAMKYNRSFLITEIRKE